MLRWLLILASPVVVSFVVLVVVGTVGGPPWLVAVLAFPALLGLGFWTISRYGRPA